MTLWIKSVYASIPTVDAECLDNFIFRLLEEIVEDGSVAVGRTAFATMEDDHDKKVNH